MLLIVRCVPRWFLPTQKSHRNKPRRQVDRQTDLPSSVDKPQDLTINRMATVETCSGQTV